MKIAILPGDGIGTEIVAEAVKVLNVLELPLELETALVGGAAYVAQGHPLALRREHARPAELLLRQPADCQRRITHHLCPHAQARLPRQQCVPWIDRRQLRTRLRRLSIRRRCHDRPV